MKRNALAALLAVAAVVPAALPAPAHADDITRRLDQIQRETRLLVSPELSPAERVTFDYGAVLALSYFSVSDSAGGTRSLYQYDLHLFTRLNFDGAHEIFLRNRLQYRDYFPGDETATDDDGLQSFFEEAFYRFNLARFLAAYRGIATTDDLTLTLGRQYVQWASGLVLAQYLDAARADLKLGDFFLTALGGVTTYGTTDFDSSRPHFDKSTYRGYFGALASYRFAQHQPFVYVLAQRDFNKDRVLVAGPVVTEFQYDSFYTGVGATGNLADNLRYSVEAVLATGTALSSPLDEVGNIVPQTEEDILAYAALASLDYLFADARRSRAGVLFLIASGDPDRQVTNETFAGNLTGTDDLAFNSLGLVSAGYAFNPPVSNLLALKLDASTFPFAASGGIPSRLQLGAELVFFGKTRTHAPIDEFTTNGDRFLGVEAGTFLAWRIFDDLTIQARYGIFFPGSAIPSDDLRQFIFTTLVYSF